MWYDTINKKVVIISSSFLSYGVGRILAAQYNLSKILKGYGYNVKVFIFDNNGIIDKDTKEVIR